MCLQFHCRIIAGGCDAVSCREDIHICDEAATTKVLQLSGHCNNSITERLKFQRSKTCDRLRWRTVLLHFNLYLYIQVPLKKKSELLLKGYTKKLNFRLRQKKLSTSPQSIYRLLGISSPLFSGNEEQNVRSVRLKTVPSRIKIHGT
jgi:hypothetical protein